MNDNNLIHRVLKTMLQPGGYYRLPDAIRIERVITPSNQQVWLVTFDKDGEDWWLSHALTWTHSLTWETRQDRSQTHKYATPEQILIAGDHGFTTPEEAFMAWLQWTENRWEG